MRAGLARARSTKLVEVPEFIRVACLRLVVGGAVSAWILDCMCTSLTRARSTKLTWVSELVGEVCLLLAAGGAATFGGVQPIAT
eukprot:3835586-Prymnesium_polylepis.1